jgi:hypothetical protein
MALILMHGWLFGLAAYEHRQIGFLRENKSYVQRRLVIFQAYFEELRVALAELTRLTLAFLKLLVQGVFHHDDFVE